MEHNTKPCHFGVSDADHSFFLECISTDGFSDEQKAQRNTNHLFYDILDEMQCPNFYFRLKRVLFKGKKTPAFSKVSKELQKLLDLINPG